MRISRIPIYILATLLIVCLVGCGGSNKQAGNPVLTDATWYAMQDGDGPWEVINMPTGMFTPTVTDPQGRYSLAYVMAIASDQRVYVFTLQTTVAELPTIDMSTIPMMGHQAELDVTVKPFEQGKFVSLYLDDNSHGIGSFNEDQSISLETTPGIQDFIATLSENDVWPTHLIVRRGLQFAPGSTLQQTVDFSTDSDVLAMGEPYTISADVPLQRGEVHLLTLNKSRAPLGRTGYFADETSFQYAPLASGLSGGDTYMIELNTRPENNQYIAYFEGFSTPGDRNVSLPSPFDGMIATNTSSGGVLPGMTDAFYSDAIGYTVEYGARSGAVTYYTMAHITAGRLGDQTSFFMPNLASAPEWNTVWSIPIGATTLSAVTSVQAGSPGASIQDIGFWYMLDKPRVSAGHWVASISNYIGDPDRSIRSIAR